MDKAIQNAYDKNKKIFHSKRENRGMQLAHIFEGADKSTVLKACFYNFASLTPAEHRDWRILKQLREGNYELRRRILSSYRKGIGCSGVGKLCYECSLLVKDLK